MLRRPVRAGRSGADRVRSGSARWSTTARLCSRGSGRPASCPSASVGHAGHGGAQRPRARRQANRAHAAAPLLSGLVPSAPGRKQPRRRPASATAGTAPRPGAKRQRQRQESAARSSSGPGKPQSPFPRNPFPPYVASLHPKVKPARNKEARCAPSPPKLRLSPRPVAHRRADARGAKTRHSGLYLSAGGNPAQPDPGKQVVSYRDAQADNAVPDGCQLCTAAQRSARRDRY